MRKLILCAESDLVPVLQRYSLPGGIRTAVIAVAVVFASVLLVMTGVIIAKWNHAVVRASSRAFALIILVCLIAMCLASITYAVDPGQTASACSLRWWLNSMPLVVVLGALFGKTDRVAKVTHILMSILHGLTCCCVRYSIRTI